MRITKYAIKNILRNKFLSISSLLVLTLLMFFINILVVVHDVSLKLIGEINSKLTISLYLDDKYDKNSIEVVKLFENIAKISKDIQVDYKDKQQSLEEIQVRDPDLAKILERTNPLPETITISNIALKQYEAVNAQVEGKMFLLSKNETDTQHFSSYSQQYEKIVGIIKILHLLQYGLYGIISIFVISISIIIYSIIGNFIYYYKNEIYITRLVGGGKKFIYGPFALQGMMYAFFAYLLSVSLFLFLIKNINSLFENTYNLTPHIALLVIQCIIFVFIGAMSGWLSSKKYIK